MSSAENERAWNASWYSAYYENFSRPNHISTEGLETNLYSIPPVGVTLLFAGYGVICVAALGGNALVLWLVLPARRMWTVTNVFLANLAVADIIISIFTIPFQFQAALLQRWDLPEFLCPVCPFVQALSVLVSVLTLSCIAVHRYVALKKPFAQKMSIAKSCFVVGLIWLVAFVIAVPTYLDYTVVYYHNWDFSVIIPYCRTTWLSDDVRWFYSQFVVLTQYFLPLLIILGAYTRMGCQLWKTTSTPGDIKYSRRDEVLQKNRRKVTRMMIGMVLLFAVCWFPYQSYNVLLIYVPNINDYFYINVVWFSIHWLAMTNSCCNPFIYAIYNANFRNEFRRRTAWICATVQCCLPCGWSRQESDRLEMDRIHRVS